MPLAAVLLGAIVAPAHAAVRLASGAVGDADASSLPVPDVPRPFAEDNRERIIDAVQKRYNARVVKVTEITVDGRRCYELRLLSDQRVWTIRVDAESGQELSGGD